MARPSRLVFGFVVLVGIAACGGPAGSASNERPSPSPPASAAPAASSASLLDPAVIHACYGLGEIDCARAMEAAAALLPAGVPVGYVQVGPFGCVNGVECDTTLLARPSGQVLFEPTTGDPLAVQVTLGAGGELRAEPAEAFMVRVAPESTPQALAGPLPFSLGHCGVGSGIDVDGSWWDPVGFVDADHGDAINAAEGTFVASDQSHATFTSAGGFTVDLLRRVGDKHLPGCM